MSSLGELAQIAVKQKADVLESGRGGYSPSLHSLFRVHLRELSDKYEKIKSRDAIFLLLYLHSYVNGTESNDLYMWAFPTVKQIRKETGIHGDRLSTLCKILESEGLLITKMVPWRGNTKKLYLPLFYPQEQVTQVPAIPVNGVA